MDISDEIRKQDAQEHRDYLLKKLNRPLRVCGMVRNVGEPGGGPFWVEDRNGNRSCQIVEKAQVDLQSQEQKEIVSSDEPEHIRWRLLPATDIHKNITFMMKSSKHIDQE